MLPLSNPLAFKECLAIKHLLLKSHKCSKLCRLNKERYRLSHFWISAASH